MSKKVAVIDPRNLWIEYKKHNNIEFRNELILRYSYLVKRVVSRLAFASTSSLDVEDLISYGILGLIDAIERYDPSKNVKFETYATFRIKGAIMDQLRKQDWVPRSLRIKYKQLAEAVDAIEKKLGRSANDKEIAQALGVTVEEVRKTMLDVHSLAVVSLEDQLFALAGSVGVFGLEDDPERVAQANELKRHLAQAIDELPEREKLVISLYYFEELTLKEIGMALGVSESRVSQLHTRALVRLRNKLSKWGIDLMGGELG
ncbi:RNA polymerase sigma factor for flagellar operon FliA [Caldicoprobacter guelmensis]|uniref:sigma-70 family RNA polymerase sigma factor n=1 Tax=Caldicoprobacter guelmensis TaxID=1170224 RepID=UPI001958C39B|nr:FliA/WhiG family RNA polymerase sigma factor [Caldicoprobacter guelmensis]MBM7581406.1 RNA polymerase sigma factor for flagellar operon FliA [Caldicoprobacter guelmensis]